MANLEAYFFDQSLQNFLPVVNCNVLKYRNVSIDVLEVNRMKSVDVCYRHSQCRKMIYIFVNMKTTGNLHVGLVPGILRQVIVAVIGRTIAYESYERRTLGSEQLEDILKYLAEMSSGHVASP